MSASPNSLDDTAPARLSDAKILLFAFAGAAVVANAYYIHPIIGVVAQDFGVDAATIGLVPALNQIALALGILLLLPLGDHVSNRRLVSLSVGAQFLAILTMAFAPGFHVFLAASTVLGFVTIAPYLLPAYVSKRVDGQHLGRTTALLTSGVVGGVLAARVSSGFITEYFGWRAVYYFAAVLLAACAVGLHRVMDGREAATATDAGGQARAQSYFALIRSMGPIVRAHPDVVVSGMIQALGFGVFLAIWLGLGLFLTGPEMNLGADVVSWLALLSGLNLLTTPRLGRLADRLGPKPARVLFLSAQLASIPLLFLAGDRLAWMIGPVLLLSLAGPPTDVCGRMTILARAPEIRTRLMTIYIVIMFCGAGLATWAATAAYAFGGWRANMAAAALFSATALLLAIGAARKA